MRNISPDAFYNYRGVVGIARAGKGKKEARGGVDSME